MKGSRRDFLKLSSASLFSLAIPESILGLFSKASSSISFGLISDLHHDIVQDGMERLQTFLSEMEIQKPNALIQLGDFAVPSPKNKILIDRFNSAHGSILHVLGNHDIDGGYSWEDCLNAYGMESSYYTRNIGGIKVIVLDGNEPGSEKYKSGYFSYIGKTQQEWLIEELSAASEPVLIISHQPIAGIYTIDNALEIQKLLARFSDKILLAINGHAHVDQHIFEGGVNYIHINSASYYWVGEKLAHQSYPVEIHEKFPQLQNTCPYSESLFALLTINPKERRIHIQGRKASWVGPSPSELNYPILSKEEQALYLNPQISSRKIG
jgi:predicted phosphodiesterase